MAFQNNDKDGAFYVNASGELVPVPTEFYNTSHGEGGQFDEGPDGPGRVRDPGTEDLGVPGTVSGNKEGKPQAVGPTGGSKTVVKKSGGEPPSGVTLPTMADLKKAPPSKKTVRDINKGLDVSGKGGQYPDWTKYPGAPPDTSGDNWTNWIKTEGGKKFLADAEKYEKGEGA